MIQRVEYENADSRAIARVGGQRFEQLDIDQDSVLTIEDFRLALQPRLQEILAAVERKDDEWIWNSFFRVGTQWMAEHRTIEANKTRILRLDIPVCLFHGRNDANTPVEGILQLQEAALRQKKNNIRVFVFDDHDHTLEFLAWIVQRSMHEGLNVLFDEIEKF